MKLFKIRVQTLDRTLVDKVFAFHIVFVMCFVYNFKLLYIRHS